MYFWQPTVKCENADLLGLAVKILTTQDISCKTTHLNLMVAPEEKSNRTSTTVNTCIAQMPWLVFYLENYAAVDILKNTSLTR